MDYIINTEAFGLQMFSDGTGGAEGASAADKGSLATSKATENGSVVAEQTESAPVDLEAEFNDLVKGKYKAQYAKRVKSAVDDRFKGTDARIQNYERFAENIANQFGIHDASDLDAIEQAIQKQSEEGIEERAFKNNRTPEEQREWEDMKRNSDRYKSMLERQERENRVRQQTESWARQADALKQSLPGFDLGEELGGNKRFSELLLGGSTVEEAYRATHPELVANAMAYTAQQVEQGVVERIKTNGLRPVENAAAQSVPISTKQDPSKMSLQDINEAIKKAQLGERVTFS